MLWELHLHDKNASVCKEEADANSVLLPCVLVGLFTLVRLAPCSPHILRLPPFDSSILTPRVIAVVSGTGHSVCMRPTDSRGGPESGGRWPGHLADDIMLSARKSVLAETHSQGLLLSHFLPFPRPQTAFFLAPGPGTAQAKHSVNSQTHAPCEILANVFSWGLPGQAHFPYEESRHRGPKGLALRPT